MLKSISRIYAKGNWQQWVIPLIAVGTIITCIQEIIAGNNNFTIFRYSSFHLLAHQPLYTAYPGSYEDYFLYHPAFPVLFMPFALLPYAISLCAFTILSTAAFIRAVQLLPGITNAAKKIILLLVLPELLNNQQYVQTNIFLTALVLFAFIYFERGKPIWAAFFTLMAFCIKGYGGIAGLLFLLYPGKQKFIGYAIVWGILISALPMIFIPFKETIVLYTDWFKMISSDEIKEGMSVIGIFGKSHINELLVTLVGLLLLCINFAGILLSPAVLSNFNFRALFCSYLLLWVVLFNRAAESPTYQLAVTGLAFWVAVEGIHRKNLYCAGAILFIVYFLPSDLFPAVIHRMFREYHLKVYPFLLFFLYLQYRLLQLIMTSARPA